MKRPSIARALTGLGIFLIGVAIAFGVFRMLPQRNPLPTQLARQDEKAGQKAADTIGVQTEAQTRDASINIDLTTKEISDAFDALPPVQPVVIGDPRPLPSAPVERVRNRLNESITRANRAANAAEPSD